MNDNSIRDVMDQALAAEPPISPDLLGDVVRAARRTRRRQAAGVIAAVAAITPAFIFGLPALTSALSSLPPGHGVVAPGHRHVVSRSDPLYLWASGGTVTAPSFSRPQLPPGVHETNPVPITRQSVGQLLIDDMPPGATVNNIMAFVGGVGRDRLAEAGTDSVYTTAGAGFVRVKLYPAARPDGNFGCRRTRAVSCAMYRLPGGVEVSEYSNTRYEDAALLMVQVTVFRPGVGILWIEETDYTLTHYVQTSYAPLTMSQMVKVALDPRWRFTIGQSFAQRASGLKVAQVTLRF
jgi:hypothetical protein